MNSQEQAAIREIDRKRAQEEAERKQAQEAPTISAGNAAEALLRQPFWKVLVRDLEVKRDEFLTLLKDPHKDLTKAQIKVLQIRIADIELFINTPMEYVVSLRNLMKSKLYKK